MDYENKTGNNQNRNHKTQRQGKVTLTKEKKNVRRKTRIQEWGKVNKKNK